MKETDDGMLWEQLFLDKPISKDALVNFQSRLMSEIMSDPVDFEEKILLAKRRKWGLGLVISLLLMVIAFGVIVWFKGAWVYQGLDILLTKFIGIYAQKLQLTWQRITQDLLLLQELKSGLSHLWGVIAWPLFGLASVYIVLSGSSDTSGSSTMS